MIGEGEKSSFHFDDCCFFVLAIFFILTCASLFLDLFFCMDRVQLVGSASGKVRALKNPGGRKKIHSFDEVFFLHANMNFNAKLRKVFGEEGDSCFDVGPGLKDKYVVIYMKHIEYIEERTRCEGAGLVAQ